MSEEDKEKQRILWEEQKELAALKKDPSYFKIERQDHGAILVKTPSVIEGETYTERRERELEEEREAKRKEQEVYEQELAEENRKKVNERIELYKQSIAKSKKTLEDKIATLYSYRLKFVANPSLERAIAKYEALLQKGLDLEEKEQYEGCAHTLTIWNVQWENDIAAIVRTNTHNLPLILNNLIAYMEKMTKKIDKLNKSVIKLEKINNKRKT